MYVLSVQSGLSGHGIGWKRLENDQSALVIGQDVLATKSDAILEAPTELQQTRSFY